MSSSPVLRTPCDGIVPGAVDRLRVLPDAMVLAAGLTSRREPASFSRRLIAAAAGGIVELILTETLLDETRAVLVDPDFRGSMRPVIADGLLAALRVVAVSVVADRGTTPPRRCADLDDDYLVDAALATGAMLVSRDDRAGFGAVAGLRSGRPGAALRTAGILE